jgi:hypothetical protein
MRISYVWKEDSDLDSIAFKVIVFETAYLEKSLLSKYKKQEQFDLMNFVNSFKFARYHRFLVSFMLMLPLEFLLPMIILIKLWNPTVSQHVPQEKDVERR